MPDRLGFDHLPQWGSMHHRCIECGWPGPTTFVSEADRIKHHAKHERDRQRKLKAQREVSLALARKTKRRKDRENA